jgi:hypothetical protein
MITSIAWKAILKVAIGYSQFSEIDFNEVFSLVACFDAVRAIISIVAHKGSLLYQLDIKSIFLDSELKEEVNVEEP